MVSALTLLFLFGRVSSQCENSKAVKLGEMLQDVLDLNSTVQALVDIIRKMVTTHYYFGSELLSVLNVRILDIFG